MAWSADLFLAQLLLIQLIPWYDTDWCILRSRRPFAILFAEVVAAEDIAFLGLP